MTFVLLQAEHFKFCKHADGIANLDTTLRLSVATERSYGRDTYQFKISEFFTYHQVWYTRIYILHKSEFVFYVSEKEKRLFSYAILIV